MAIAEYNTAVNMYLSALFLKHHIHCVIQYICYCMSKIVAYSVVLYTAWGGVYIYIHVNLQYYETS